MDKENLSISFQEIEKRIALSDYLQEICSAIINKSISKKSIDEVLKRKGVNYSVAKILHFLFQ